MSSMLPYYNLRESVAAHIWSVLLLKTELNISPTTAVPSFYDTWQKNS